MKKLISMLLVLMSLVSLFGVALAETPESEPEVVDYKITEYNYDGLNITGKENNPMVAQLVEAIENQ